MVDNRIVRALSDNWALKLAALALAILLWMAVRADDPEAATFRNVPVNVDLRDPGWRLVEVEPEAVHVTVLGPTSELLTLASDPPRIVLPVERVADSVETQVVPVQWVQLPRPITRARVVGLRPDTIRLRYERLATRSLPVRVRLEGQVEEGYELVGPIATNPSTVEVRGPARLVTAMDSVPLMPVDLSGLRSTTNVPARVDSVALGPIRASPPEVNVVLRVVPRERDDELDEGPAPDQDPRSVRSPRSTPR
jgi:YbbR domain-containing protein